MQLLTASATSESTQDLGEDRVRGVLDLLLRLLSTAGDRPVTLAALLAELARAFEAVAAGTVGPLGSPATVTTRVDTNGRLASRGRYPWDERPELLEQTARTVSALPIQQADRSTWLLTTLGSAHDGGWVLWLEGAATRSWSAAETAALALAGQALARLADAGVAAPGLARALERARHQSRLEHAAVITGRLAHDFGNVLTTIQGFAELTHAQLPTASLPRRYVNEVVQAAQEGAGWIQRLLLFSRRRAQAFVPAALAAVVAEEQGRLRKDWNGTIALHLALPGDLPLLALDAASLREVVAQLLNNAHEAIVGAGVVSLSARVTDLTEQDCQEVFGSAAPGRHIEITIADSGCGLGLETRRRLLADPFFSTKPRHRGLGLAVVYGILQAFRGGLRFGPEAHKGTTVRVFLPAADTPMGQLSQPGLAPSTSSRVLVVDDDPLTLQFLASMLASAGYRVRAAGGAAEALDLFTTGAEPFDLVLTDIAMPQTDGFELVRRLQSHNAAVNVLFISSQVPGKDCSSNALLRQFGLLQKPFRPAALLRAVRQALAQKRNGQSA
jgi:signal transduction histidine kinase/CheY-like chemotaxis protein